MSEVYAIPPELLSHPALEQHPQIKEMHEKHGGLPADAPPECLEAALGFANSVANSSVHPSHQGTLRRSDPSPRRTARVWRSQLLGHRDASVSPDKSPVRYKSRSRSRPPNLIAEEPGAPLRRFRSPGNDMIPEGSDDDGRGRKGTTAQIQQQMHRLAQAFDKRLEGQDQRIAQVETRNQNRILHYLGQPLLPVTNGKDPVPPNLPPLTSLIVIQDLSPADTRAWIEYYTGVTPAIQHDTQRDAHGHEVTVESVPDDVRRALRACTGVDAMVVA